MAKAKAESGPSITYVYVTRGPHAGQFLQMNSDAAEIAEGDKWGRPTDGPEGFAIANEPLPEGWSASPYDLPQSCIDFETYANDAIPPDTGPAPVLTSLSPNTAELGGPDVTMSAIGENFNEACRIVFAGNQENTVFVSDTELTTIVTASLGWGVTSVPVFVRNVDQSSATLDFTFTEAPPPEEDE
jgi:hypothetical protein